MSWPVVSLGEVVSLTTGPFGSALHQHDYVVGGVPLINPTHIKNGQFQPDETVAVGAEKFEELRAFAVDEGDILMGRRGEMGRCAVVTESERGWLCGTGSIIVRPTKQVDSNFLQRFLSAPATARTLEGDSVGTTMVNLNQKILLGLKLALPPLPEQRRIAAILDKADALRAKRRLAIAKLDQLLQSVFLEMFGDPVTNPKGWKLLPLTEVGKWVSGATPNKSEAAYWGGEFPWVSPKDMKVSEISDAQDHVTERAFSETNLKAIEPGHLLIVVRGMILAHSFPTAINRVPIAINQDMKAIRPNQDVDVVYLKAAVDALKVRILGVVSTAGHGTRRLDTRDASEVLVPMPPPQQQKRFRLIVESHKHVLNAAESQSANVKHLFASLQQQSFSGA